MNLANSMRGLLLSLGVSVALAPLPVRACAACFGQSDSPLAHGMNMGILSLLLFVVFVLGGIASFFVYLARRAASVSTTDASSVQPAPAQAAE